MIKEILKKLTLQQKILSLIILLNLLLIFSTLFIVNFITKKEVNEHLQIDLKKTQTLFENYLNLRDKEIAVEDKLVGEIPFLKALISTKDRATVFGFAKGSQEQIGSDLFVITDGNGDILASTDERITSEILKNEVSTQEALRGKEVNGFIFSQNTLYKVTTVPIGFDNNLPGASPLGTITIGFRVDDKLAEEIKKMTNSEISFIVGNDLVASTWDEGHQQLIKEGIELFKSRLGLASERDHQTIPPFDWKVGNESYLSILIPLVNHGKHNEYKGAYLIQRSRNEVTQFLSTIRNTIFMVSLLIFSFAAWMGYVVVKQITEPITTLVKSSKTMAEGNLSVSVPVKNQDEIGILAQAFNEMAEKLRHLILQVRENTLAVSEVSRKLHSASNGISTEISNQEKAVEETTVSITQMSTSIQEVNKNVEILSLSTNNTSSSILEMDSSINEIVNHTNNLSKTMDYTSSSIVELTSSVQKIAESIETLQKVTEDTATSLHELSASVQQVEKNAQKSHESSEKTVQEAQKGVQSVHETMSGMQEIKTSFMELQEIISRLAGKSESIGKIVKVIAEIAEQINLLSLNAAIIAAQAGEYGKGFLVVAEEVKSLAGRTATSTQDIADLIKGVQDETANAVSAMINGSERVKKGVILSNEAGAVLKGIIESSNFSTEMVSQIVRATQEQAIGIQEVDKAMFKIKDMVQQINQASHEQKKASGEIMNSTENMRKLGQEVKRSTQEQSKGSKLITSSVEKVMEMTHQILQATQEQTTGSNRINYAVQVFKGTTNANVQRATEMNNIVAILSEHSAQLEKEIGKFKI